MFSKSIIRPVVAATTLLSSLMLCSLALAQPGAVGETDELVTGSEAISDNGVHIVRVGDRVDGSGNDPRAEYFFTTRITPGSSDPWQFHANYHISSARRTTIAQILNTDNSLSDSNQPVMFLNATRRSDGSVFVCNGLASNATSCAPRIYWDNLPSGFRVRMNGDGQHATVTINGRRPDNADDDGVLYTSEGLDIQTTTQTHRILSDGTEQFPRTRNGGFHRVRWGAYHHDITNRRAASEARVRVYNIDDEGF